MRHDEVWRSVRSGRAARQRPWRVPAPADTFARVPSRPPQRPADRSRAPARRDFLRRVGAAAGAALLVPVAGALAGCAPGVRTASATPPTARRAAPPLLGVQLYTVRELMARDPDGTLAALAAIGYRTVELHTRYQRTPAALRAMLDGHGLAAPSGHESIAALRANAGQVLDDAAVLGHRWVVLPWLDRADRTPDGFHRVAAELNRWGEQARTRGLTLGYHNHDFEFAPLDGATDGRTGWDLLLAETDPSLVTFEVDVYWMAKAGRDPIDFVVRHPTRVALLHAKDATAAPERRMVDVGAGTLDFARLVREATRIGVGAVFVEHDQPTDALATARAGYAHLHPLLRSL